MALRSMEARRTIRKFTDEPVSDQQITELLLAAMYAPSAWGKRSWEFIVVDNEPLKKEIGTLTPYSAQAASAPIDILVLADKTASNSWIEDASVAAEHINLAAAKMGLGSSWIQVRGMQHNTEDAETYARKLLQIPDNFGICCIIAVGYPAEKKSPHRSGEYDREKVHFNRFGDREIA
ncbi:MAG TPA: nitroreductase family protein [Candidatus Aquicultor sp.]|jgi:nitroreductase